jgi:hypothetical protein
LNFRYSYLSLNKLIKNSRIQLRSCAATRGAQLRGTPAYDRNSNGGHDFLGMGYTTRDTVDHPLTPLHCIHRQGWEGHVHLDRTSSCSGAVFAIFCTTSALSKNPLLSRLRHVKAARDPADNKPYTCCQPAMLDQVNDVVYLQISNNS